MKWKEAVESKGLKVELGLTNVMVDGGITKDIYMLLYSFL